MPHLIRRSRFLPFVTLAARLGALVFGATMAIVLASSALTAVNAQQTAPAPDNQPAAQAPTASDQTPQATPATPSATTPEITPAPPAENAPAAPAPATDQSPQPTPAPARRNSTLARSCADRPCPHFSARSRRRAKRNLRRRNQEPARRQATLPSWRLPRQRPQLQRARHPGKPLTARLIHSERNPNRQGALGQAQA